MEYTYAALLLHATKQPLNEENLKKVLTTAGAKADDLKVKALVTALEGVDIEQAVQKAAVVSAPAPEAKKEEKKAAVEEEKSEEKKEEEAAAGLASLFG